MASAGEQVPHSTAGGADRVRPALHPITLQYDDSNLEHAFQKWYNHQMKIADYQGAWLVAFLIMSTTVRDMVIMLTSSSRHTLVLGTSHAHHCAQLHSLLIALRLVTLAFPSIFRKHRRMLLYAVRIVSCLPLLLTIPSDVADAASTAYVAAVVMYTVSSSFLSASAAKLLFQDHVAASIAPLAGLTLLLTKAPWRPHVCNVCVGICQQAKEGNGWCVKWVHAMNQIAKPLYGALHQHLSMVTGITGHDGFHDTPCLTACALSLLASHLLGGLVMSVLLYYRELQLRMRYLLGSGVGGAREAVEAFKQSGLAYAWTLYIAANLIMWSWAYLLAVAAGLHFLL